jgi:hypothetical protein
VGLESCETTPTAFVVWPSLCTGGNAALGVLAKSSIGKTAGSVQEEARSGAPLAHEEGPRLSMELRVTMLGLRVGFPLYRATTRIS